MLTGHLPLVGHGATQVFITDSCRNMAADDLQIIGIKHFFEAGRTNSQKLTIAVAK